MLPHLMDAWNSFQELSPGRTIFQGGEGFISAQEIEAYCRLAGLDDPEDRLDLFRMIRTMDAAYLRERERMREEKRTSEEKAKAAAKASKPKP